MLMLTGVAVAPGEAIGPAVVVRLRAHDVRYRIANEDVASEQARLAAASDRTRAQLEEIRDRTRHVLGAELAGMFDVQLLMLADPLLRERADALIRTRHVNAEWAVVEAGEELMQRLRAIEDPYLQERHGDLNDVLGRVRANLQRDDSDANWLNAQLARFAEPCVFVADDLPVSVAAQLDWSRLAALATDAGTRTAHTAILARSMGVPAVVGLQEATRMVPPGAVLLVDGTSGVIAVDPPPAVVEATRHRLQPAAVAAAVALRPGVHGRRDGHSPVRQRRATGRRAVRVARGRREPRARALRTAARWPADSATSASRCRSTPIAPSSSTPAIAR